MKREIGSMMAAGVVAALIFAGCGTARQAAPSAPPELETKAWYQEVERRAGIVDKDGHGPDAGSDEWMIAISRALKVYDDQGHGPDMGSDEWYRCVHMKLFNEAPAAPEPNAQSMPSEPKPHPEKYAFQIIELEVPSDQMFNVYPEMEYDPISQPAAGFSATAPMPKQATVEKLIHVPGAKIQEYPVIYASLGETAIVDQTETKEMLEDCKVVDGETIKTMETVKFGRSAEVLISKIDGSNIAYSVKAENRTLKGYETYTLENGDQVNFPYYTSSGVNTRLTQPPNTWVMLGGLVEERTENGVTTKISQLVCIRVVPPAAAE